jgi:hypothetical protein
MFGTWEATIFPEKLSLHCRGLHAGAFGWVFSLVIRPPRFLGHDTGCFTCIIAIFCSQRSGADAPAQFSPYPESALSSKVWSAIGHFASISLLVDKLQTNSSYF